MDYKYIEQLLERYWQCETSLEEESILQTFFRQEEMPAHLLRFKNLFVYEQIEAKLKLGDDFDTKVLAQIEKPVVKAKKLTLTSRFIPLFKAAAVVAIILSLGNISQHSLSDPNLDYNYDAYQDTYNDPQVAYRQISSALMMVSESINKSQNKQTPDSIVSEIIDAGKTE